MAFPAWWKLLSVCTALYGKNHIVSVAESLWPCHCLRSDVRALARTLTVWGNLVSHKVQPQRDRL